MDRYCDETQRPSATRVLSRTQARIGCRHHPKANTSTMRSRMPVINFDTYSVSHRGPLPISERSRPGTGPVRRRSQSERVPLTIGKRSRPRLRRRVGSVLYLENEGCFRGEQRGKRPSHKAARGCHSPGPAGCDEQSRERPSHRDW